MALTEESVDLRWYWHHSDRKAGPTGGRTPPPIIRKEPPVTTPTPRSRLTGAGLGTLVIRSAVRDGDVVISYELPASVKGTSSRGCTLDGEPIGSGAVHADSTSSSRYVAGLELADLAPGDHIYTVAATIEGKVLSGSTIFTTPAA
jgi:hypothetical protein